MSWLAPVAVLAGLLTAAPAPVSVYREFRDWIVAWANLRRCTAYAAPNGVGASVAL